MNMNKPCSCMGNNERCYKCFGSGYLSGSVSSSRSTFGTANQGKGKVFSRSRGGASKKKGKSLPGQAQKSTAPPLPDPRHPVKGGDSAPTSRTLLQLPQYVPKPSRLMRDDVLYNLCDRCGFYVMGDRMLVHDEVCASLHPGTQARTYGGPDLRHLKRTDSEIACPRCFHLVGKGNLSRHLVRTHRLSQSEAALLAHAALTSAPPGPSGSTGAINVRTTGVGGQSYTKCDACDKDVPSKRFLVHLEICPAIARRKRFAVTGVASTPALASEPASPTRPIASQASAYTAPATMQSCPICLCKVRGANMASHLQRVHPPVTSPLPARVKQQGSVASEPAATRYDKGGGGDGGKYLGYLAREQGRFGSMPSYDDYSDEGKAD